MQRGEPPACRDLVQRRDELCLAKPWHVALVADGKPSLLGDEEEPDLAGEGSSRLVDEPLERVVKRLGRGMEQLAHGIQRLELVRQPLRRPDLEDRVAGAPSETAKILVGDGLDPVVLAPKSTKTSAFSPTIATERL